MAGVLQPAKLCQVGWGALLQSYFRVSPEMSDWVQVRALAGSLNDIQRLVPKTLLRCLGCVLRVVVLLEGEPQHDATTIMLHRRDGARFPPDVTLAFRPKRSILVSSD